MSNATKPRPTVADQQRAEAEARAKRHAQNQIALAIENSHPATMKRLLSGAAVPAYGNNSDALRAECAKQAKSVQAITTQLDEGLAQLGTALSACTESGTYGDVFAAIEAIRFDKATLAQQIVTVWSSAADLAAKLEAELAPLPAKLDAASEKTVAEVKAQLSEIGSGVEVQIAYGKNSGAAEHQFNFQARQNVRARAASKLATDARAEQQAAAQRKHASHRGLEAARDYLHKVVLKSISS